jgi:hypothetical protein
MTKFIKTLIIVNGLIVPSAVLVLLIMLITDLIQTSSRRSHPDVLKTENTITKEGDTLILQGLDYSNPRNVYNSSNFIILVSPKTYKEPLRYSSELMSYEGGSPLLTPYDNYVNVLFLDSNYDVIGPLVNRKASIQSLTVPSSDIDKEIDTTVNNIGYLIAFDDSNNDKKIDSQDNYDLYISDLNGKNLIQVTKGIDIQDFKFINNHKEIFISFTNRADIRDEYKIKKFAVFNIRTKQFKELSSIDKALSVIHKIIK